MDDVGTPGTATSGGSGAEEVRLAEVRVDPPHLIGGDAAPVIGTVTLSAAAPPGGADVEIFTDRPEVLVTPAVVHVREGEVSQTFGLVVHAVEQHVAAFLTANYAGQSLWQVLAVRAAEAATSLAAQEAAAQTIGVTNGVAHAEADAVAEAVADAVAAAAPQPAAMAVAVHAAADEPERNGATPPAVAATPTGGPHATMETAAAMADDHATAETAAADNGAAAKAARAVTNATETPPAASAQTTTPSAPPPGAATSDASAQAVAPSASAQAAAPSASTAQAAPASVPSQQQVQPANPDWPRCAQSVRAAFLLALPAVPFVALIATLAIYAAPSTSLANGLDPVPAGTLIALGLWILFAILQRLFIRGTSADQVNASAYKELRHQIGEVYATRRMLTASDPTGQIAMQQLDSYLAQTHGELGQSGPDWILGSGYISVWSLVHRAQESLLLVAPTSQVIAGALYDEQRLTGSQIDNNDQLLSKLRLALARLDANAANYLNGRPSVAAAAADATSDAATAASDDAKLLARVALREVRQTINDFRDTSWAAIVRSRNHLMATMTATGLATYLGLALTIAITGQMHATNPASDAVLAAATYYLLGSMVGLFNRLSIESNAQNDVEDYGLTVARLSLTPVLSGLAAVGGVFITAVAASGVAGAVLSQSGTGAGAGAGFNLPSLATVYSLSANPLGLLLAAIFGFSPNMLIGALQAQADRYTSALKSTAPQTH